MKRTIMNILMCGCIAVALFCCISCNDDLDIHQSYEFTVETMPVPKELAKGESAEIRCTLKRSDEFADALYTIRYFQFDGEGTLSLNKSLVLLPNDRYLFENEQFRCTTHPGVRSRRISWWSWRTISVSPASWSLISSMTTETAGRMKQMTAVCRSFRDR